MKKLTNIVILIVLVVAVFLGGKYVGSCSSQTEIGKYIQQVSQLKQEAQAVLDTNKVLKKNEIEHLDSITFLQTQVDNITKSISVKESQVKKLRQKNDSMLQSIKSDSNCNNTCQLAVQNAESFREESDSNKAISDSLKKVIDFKNLQYKHMTQLRDLAVTRADNAERELQKFIDLPPPKDPDKLFGIKLPSRTTTFFIGVLVGGTASAIAN